LPNQESHVISVVLFDDEKKNRSGCLLLSDDLLFKNPIRALIGAKCSPLQLDILVTSLEFFRDAKTPSRDYLVLADRCRMNR
jgi:hypothetical protein